MAPRSQSNSKEPTERRDEQAQERTPGVDATGPQGSPEGPPEEQLPSLGAAPQERSRSLGANTRTTPTDTNRRSRSLSRVRANPSELTDDEWASRTPTTQNIGGAREGSWRDRRGRFTYTPEEYERLSRTRDVQRAAMSERELAAASRAQARTLTQRPPTTQSQTDDEPRTPTELERRRAAEIASAQQPPHPSSPGAAPSTIVGASAERSVITNTERSWAVLSETDAQTEGGGTGLDGSSPAQNAGEGAENVEADRDRDERIDRTLSDVGSWVAREESSFPGNTQENRDAGQARVPVDNYVPPPEIAIDKDDSSESATSHDENRKEIKDLRELVKSLKHDLQFAQADNMTLRSETSDLENHISAT